MIGCGPNKLGFAQNRSAFVIRLSNRDRKIEFAGVDLGPQIETYADRDLEPDRWILPGETAKQLRQPIADEVFGNAETDHT